VEVTDESKNSADGEKGGQKASEKAVFVCDNWLHCAKGDKLTRRQLARGRANPLAEKAVYKVTGSNQPTPVKWVVIAHCRVVPTSTSTPTLIKDTH
jgi:hypothetical protein